MVSEFLSTARKLFVKCRDLSQYNVSPSNYKRMHSICFVEVWLLLMRDRVCYDMVLNGNKHWKCSCTCTEYIHTELTSDAHASSVNTLC